MEHPLAAGQEGSPLPLLFLIYPSLPFAFTQGQQLSSPQVPVLGGRSKPETEMCVAYTGEQQCLFPFYTSCQAAKKSEFHTG